MQEDFLEELRKGFIEAIAAHKFMELKLGSDRSMEINKLKQQWSIIKQNFNGIPELEVNPNSPSSKYNNFELHLLKLQRELEATKTQLLQQQRVTNNLIRKNLNALKQIQELQKIINQPDSLDVTTINDIDLADLETLKNLLNEL